MSPTVAGHEGKLTVKSKKQKKRAPAGRKRTAKKASTPLSRSTGHFRAAKKSGTAALPELERRRVRLEPAVRAAMILDEAVAFFAEHGFEAQVRELSERLGVSQGLIFRYFGTKQNLLEQVYQRVYVTRWSNDWDVLLRDRSRPLHDRLIDFYRAYLTAVDQYEWIRVSLYSGLAGYDLTRRYVMTRVELLLEVIIDELRRLAPAETLPERADALHEVVWHLHSTFVYYLVRKYVFRIPTLDEHDVFVGAVVGHFLSGFKLNPARRRQAARQEAPAAIAGLTSVTLATPAARMPANRGGRYRAKPAHR